MRNIYSINKWLVGVTIILYFTFWGGIVAQYILGAFQTLTTLYFLIHFRKLNRVSKILLITYIFATLTTVFWFRSFSNNSHMGIGIAFLWILVTMLLACFHLYITYKIHKS